MNLELILDPSNEILGRGNYSGGFLGTQYILHPNDLTDVHQLFKPSTVVQENITVIPEESETLIDESQTGLKEKGKSKTYHSIETKALFFKNYFDQDKKNIAKAAAVLGVSAATARKWVKEFEETGKITVYCHPLKSILKNEHERFIITQFERYKTENRIIQSNELLNDLKDEFPELKVGLTTLRTKLKEMGYSYKNVVKEVMARNTDVSINKRFDWISELEQRGIDYKKNCVFIDESAFDENIRLKKGWCALGESPVVREEKTRAQTYTILGAITCYQVIDLSIKTKKNCPVMKGSTVLQKDHEHSSKHIPIPVSSSGRRKRKRNENPTPLEVTKLSFQGNGQPGQATDGTKKDHFMYFLSNVMKTLRYVAEKKEYFIILDNARIHYSREVEDLVKKSNELFHTKFRLFFLPPYSPQLNPIELYWATLKHKFAVNRTDNLVDRLIQANSEVSREFLTRCVEHSMKFFSVCKNKEKLINIKD